MKKKSKTKPKSPQHRAVLNLIRAVHKLSEQVQGLRTDVQFLRKNIPGYGAPKNLGPATYEDWQLQMALNRAAKYSTCPKCGQTPYDGHYMCCNTAQGAAEHHISEQQRQA